MLERPALQVDGTVNTKPWVRSIFKMYKDNVCGAEWLIRVI